MGRMEEKRKEDIRWNRRKTDLPVPLYLILAVILMALGYAIGELFH